jgi:hypothetical protein
LPAFFIASPSNIQRPAFLTFPAYAFLPIRLPLSCIQDAKSRFLFTFCPGRRAARKNHCLSFCAKILFSSGRSHANYAMPASCHLFKTPVPAHSKFL